MSELLKMDEINGFKAIGARGQIKGSEFVVAAVNIEELEKRWNILMGNPEHPEAIIKLDVSMCRNVVILAEGAFDKQKEK